MSEYISSCPKCRRQILCDTAYAGQRVSCPLCVQEIIMPNPPAGTVPASALVAAKGPRTVPAPLVVGGLIFLALVAGAVIFLGPRNSSQAAPPAPAVAAVVPQAVVPLAPAPQPSSQPVVPQATVPTPVAAAPVHVFASATPAANQPLPRARWTFDEYNGSTANDATGNGFNAHLIGNAIWTKSARVGSGALSFSGASYAEVASPVVDVTQSFTVTAWVNLLTLNDNQPCQTAVSMDGDESSSFYLQLNHGAGNAFVFNRPATMVKSTFSPVPNTWYHLAGVYDAEARTIALYVNGNLQESAPYDNPMPATGKTAIGRALFNHAKTDFFYGSVDDIRIYDVPLTALQIHDIANNR